MALIKAQCTNCNGTLDIDENKDAAICPFCGSAFIVEKAIQQYVTNNQSGVENGTVRAHFWRDYVKFFAIGMGLILLAPNFIYVLIMLIATLLRTEPPVWLIIPPIILGIVIAIIVLAVGAIVASKSNKKRQTKLESDAAEARKRVAQMEAMTGNDLSDEEFWLTFEQIPETYQYTFAINKFAEYFYNGRVTSMKEAINLLEEELHRMRMENAIALQNIELERQNIQNQLRNSYLLNISSKQTYYEYRD